MRYHQKLLNHQKERKQIIRIYNDKIIDDKNEFLFLKCDISGCDKYYKSLSLLNLHKKSHTKPYKCLYDGKCAKSFSRNTDLKLHQLRIHKNIKIKENLKICTFCDIKFSSKSSLSKHIESIHAKIEKKFVCKKCHKRFNRKDELQSHFKRHLSISFRTRLNCHHCDSSFSTNSNLNKHIKKFHNIQPL